MLLGKKGYTDELKIFKDVQFVQFTDINGDLIWIKISTSSVSNFSVTQSQDKIN